MIESVLIGTSIGYALLVLFQEFESRACRLCVAFWLSVLAAAVTGNWLGIGVINLAAHVSYVIFSKVCYDVQSVAFSVRVETSTSSKPS